MTQSAEKDVRYSVVNGWLVEEVNEHTCGAGRDGYYGAHEPGCGLSPIARVDDLLAAPAAERARALRDAADQLDRDGMRRLRASTVKQWLRARADRECPIPSGKP